ncbi:hypothetical protein A2U01_0103672, partial [Trifolium medium]|nr:hypothetical protein [Trifolium medium]
MNFAQKMLKMKKCLYSPEESINFGSIDKGDLEPLTDLVDMLTQHL